MTVYDWRELIGLANRIRLQIYRSGPQHSMWDVVFDLEAIARGDDPRYDREMNIRLAKEFLGEL